MGRAAMSSNSWQTSLVPSHGACYTSSTRSVGTSVHHGSKGHQDSRHSLSEKAVPKVPQKVTEMCDTYSQMLSRPLPRSNAAFFIFIIHIFLPPGNEESQDK